VNYLADIYSRIHKGIKPYPVYIDADNVNLLAAMNFVFLSLDNGPAKKQIVAYLEDANISFIDCGIGLYAQDEALGGIVRITASTPDKRSHIHDKNRIPFFDMEGDNLYAKNIQVAELNALNATLAVIKWKKMLGFYTFID
jgi:hypothetical protein